ncbi:Hpt domain-containing protein [Jeongeupia chitinilytica]|uniref:HPt domain-containing protein n=1 Tax=Jeongeupia chitinilytica TaxID=1041641 RepID=A0ABQ3GWG0_9NEIS|nr:Hpt domain-containing protein [Jeongeupia chitinilytica]GHD58503.1 hypothetical protein GCM10007350_08470 [Jeongeupia chitinilytica]
MPPPPPDLQHELAAIDAAFAALARDLGQDLRAELLDAYWPTHEACLAEIGLALQQGQHYLAERAAHQLKGACAQIGATGMAARCRGIELAARDARSADDAYAELQVLAAGIESALRR